ncbi:MAG: helix-turn-helix domain-containing protein [Salinivirgaceae bacterium]|jgi:hypothetical protein|nr:helix-turn-helix domain-containing protein [Salinivirgaceae bacterium]
MENSSNILNDFFKKLESKILDDTFQNKVLKELEEIKSELASIKQECIDYQRKKYFDEFIPVKDIPELLNKSVSKRTIETWISEKLILPIQIKKIRFFRRDLFDKFMEDHQVK